MSLTKTEIENALFDKIQELKDKSNTTDEILIDGGLNAVENIGKVFDEAKFSNRVIADLHHQFGSIQAGGNVNNSSSEELSNDTTTTSIDPRSIESEPNVESPRKEVRFDETTKTINESTERTLTPMPSMSELIVEHEEKLKLIIDTAMHNVWETAVKPTIVGFENQKLDLFGKILDALGEINNSKKIIEQSVDNLKQNINQITGGDNKKKNNDDDDDTLIETNDKLDKDMIIGDDDHDIDETNNKNKQIISTEVKDTIEDLLDDNFDDMIHDQIDNYEDDDIDALIGGNRFRTVKDNDYIM